jgi:hypothetical protein
MKKILEKKPSSLSLLWKYPALMVSSTLALQSSVLTMGSKAAAAYDHSLEDTRSMGQKMLEGYMDFSVKLYDTTYGKVLPQSMTDQLHANAEINKKTVSQAFLRANYPFLFDQDMVNTKEFQSLTRRDQDRQLLRIFRERKNEVLNKKINSNLSNLLIGYPLLLGGLYLHLNTNVTKNIKGAIEEKGPAVLDNLSRHPFLTLLAVYSGLAAVGTTGYTVYKFGKSHVDLFTALKEKYWEGRKKDLLEDYEIEYFLKKRFMEPPLQAFVEDKLLALHKNLSSPGNVEKIVDSLKISLGMYRDDDKKIAYDTKKFQENFDGYKQEVRDGYRLFYMSQVLREGANPSQKTNLQGNASILYLKGRPGTGKTMSVEALSQVMDANVVKISLNESNSNLFGTAEDPGLLARQMAAQNDGRPQILFIDEFDRGNPDMSRLLKILDPTTKSYFNPYYQCEISLPKIRIVAGNVGIQDPALLNRLQILEYNGFEPAYKKTVLLQRVKDFMEELSQNKTKTLAYNELTSKDHAFIEELIEKDKDIGFRTSEKLLYWYVTHLIDKKYNPTVTTPNFIGMLEKENKNLEVAYRVK